MIEDSGVWFHQTFRLGVDDIYVTELEAKAKEYRFSHNFFLPPDPPFSAGVRFGKQAMSVPCRWVEAWDAILNDVFVRFDIMGKLKPGAFFAKFCAKLTAYTAGVDGPGIRFYWSNGTVSDVNLKNWLEGDYEWS